MTTIMIHPALWVYLAKLSKSEKIEEISFIEVIDESEVPEEIVASEKLIKELIRTEGVQRSIEILCNECGYTREDAEYYVTGTALGMRIDGEEISD